MRHWMVATNIILAILDIGLSYSYFTQGNTASGILWLVQAPMWLLTAYFNAKNN